MEANMRTRTQFSVWIAAIALLLAGASGHLHAQEREHFGVTAYPGAHHLFDEPGANRQHREQTARNGMAVIRYDAESATRSCAFAEQFFSRHLAAKT
jgi:dienelactone hydrolase